MICTRCNGKGKIWRLEILGWGTCPSCRCSGEVPDHASGDRWGDCALGVLLLLVLLPIMPLVLLLGLCVAGARKRSAAILLGLALAIGCGVTGIVFLADPQIEGGTGALFFPWAGLGVYIVVKALSKR